MSGTNIDKDELAARALTRLADPPLPDGLAARITARATAKPQIEPSASPSLDAAALVAAKSAPSAAQPRRFESRRRIFAGASLCALLLAVGLVAALRSSSDEPVIAAGEERTLPAPAVKPAAPSKLAEAAPPETLPTKVPHKMRANRDALMMLPPPAAPPVEPAAEDAPPAAPTGSSPTPAEERLAQRGPRDPSAEKALRPVYGPPAPVGLGIAGTPGGGNALPGTTGPGSRAPSGGAGSPPSGPPPGMPGPGGPRGPGPRL